ncbi:MAG TPA: hypothetical protein VG406_02675 [Isosphaeraceae bacterium]|jgi:hypothetical protein|nr:hypothetical protein [Isosphaeraceae bacterium]
MAWARTPRDRSARRGRPRARRSTFDVLEGRIAPATFLVVNALDGPGSGPSGSLRDAINRADPSGDASDTVVITSKVRGPIVLNSGELAIDASLSIVNRSGRPVEIRQATPGARVFHVTDSPLAARVSIGGASDRAAILIDGGDVTTGNGGGILAENPAGVLTLSHVVLVGNSAGLASSTGGSQDGGGLYSSGSVVLDQSTIGTPFAPNQASGDGGGLWAGAGVTLTGSTVAGNQAGADGGGLFVASGDAVVSRSRVDGNRAENVGGINEVKGDVRVVNGSELNGNSSTAALDVSQGDFGGGAIYAGVGDVFVARSQIRGNHSIGMYSSGIVVGLGSVTVTAGSRIVGNSNNGPGGGIAANFGGVVTVSGGSQVDHNTGAGIGGGIVNFAGPMGGVRILGGSEVSHNTLTNGETLGQAVGVFLQVLAGALGVDLATATGGTTAAALQAEIAQLEQVAASTAAPGTSTADPPGFLVAGGGIGTLVGASISVGGGSHVDGNLAGAPASVGDANYVGIGGGLFSAVGTTTVRGSTVDGNTAPGSGGGIWNLGALSLVDGAVVGNHAAARGGGIANRGPLSIIRTPVVANTPDNIIKF